MAAVIYENDERSGKIKVYDGDKILDEKFEEPMIKFAEKLREIRKVIKELDYAFSGDSSFSEELLENLRKQI